MYLSLCSFVCANCVAICVSRTLKEMPEPVDELGQQYSRAVVPNLFQSTDWLNVRQYFYGPARTRLEWVID